MARFPDVLELVLVKIILVKDILDIAGFQLFDIVATYLTVQLRIFINYFYRTGPSDF